MVAEAVTCTWHRRRGYDRNSSGQRYRQPVCTTYPASFNNSSRFPVAKPATLTKGTEVF